MNAKSGDAQCLQTGSIWEAGADRLSGAYGVDVWTGWQAAALQRNRSAWLGTIAVGCLSGMMALLVHGLIDNTMWNTRAAFLPWLVIGTLAALHRYAYVMDENACTGSSSGAAKTADCDSP